MSTPDTSRIPCFDAQEFRRRIAGLSDTAGGEDLFDSDYRDLASDYVLLLAIGFNRKQLDAKTLWTRIESAVQRGLAECDGEDLEQFASIGLEHVLANVSVVASHPDALAIQERLYGLTNEQRVRFLQYLAKHLYPAIVFGRQKWEQRKQDLQTQAQRIAVEAGEETA